MIEVDKHHNSSAWILRNLQIAFFTIAICYFGKALLVPLFFGLLIAISVYPACKRMEQRKLPKSLAISICLFGVLSLFLAIGLLLVWQINVFREDMPELLRRLRPIVPDILDWMRREFSISVADQDKWLSDLINSFSNNAGHLLQTTLNVFTEFLISAFLVPIYAALFLYHRRNFVNFLRHLVAPEHKPRLNAAIHETVHTYFNYIKGMVIVYLIVGVLNSVGLLALGIKHAILFGMLTAIMTIIPYIGIIISAAIPVAIAFITKDSLWYPVGVVFIFVFVQYLEANIIFPRVVGEQLNVSTWAMLVAIVAGGLIWGAAGMVLFIPFVSMLKIASNHMEGMEPLRFLLDRNPEITK